MKQRLGVINSVRLGRTKVSFIPPYCEPFGGRFLCQPLTAVYHRFLQSSAHRLSPGRRWCQRVGDPSEVKEVVVANSAVRTAGQAVGLGEGGTQMLGEQPIALYVHNGHSDSCECLAEIELFFAYVLVHIFSHDIERSMCGSVRDLL